jgi:hypothetical protein
MNVAVGITAVVVGGGVEIIVGGSRVGEKTVVLGMVMAVAGSSVGVTAISASPTQAVRTKTKKQKRFKGLRNICHRPAYY